MLPALSGEREVEDRLVPVVLGADILGYSYVRSFYDAYGITSIVLATADVKATSSSKFCDYRIVEDIDTAKVLLPYLDRLADELAAQGKVGLLVGCGDWYARILSEHKPELSRRFYVPYIDFDLLDDITQKERFYARCEELGIPYPKTWCLDCAAPDPAFDADAFTYPLIAKPSNSAVYHYAEFPGKKKIFEVEDADELRVIYRNICASSYDRELIIQDFIPGPDDLMRSITVFVDRHGEPAVVAGGRVVLQDHAPSAIGNPVCILSEHIERAVEDACRLLKGVGYRGYANFDVKYDSRDGSYRFFEVNTRPGRNSYYVTLGGVNFVAPIVDDFVLQRDIPHVDAFEPFVYACVPSYVVRRSVADAGLRRQVLDMYRSGRAHFPLANRKDSLAHAVWSFFTYMNQIPKFKRYLWDTGGKQAKAD